MVTRPRKRSLPVIFPTGLCLRWKTWNCRLQGGEGIFLELSRPEYSFPACSDRQSPPGSKPHGSWKERAVCTDVHLLLCLSSLPQRQQGDWCPCSFFWGGCGREGCLSRATSFLLLWHQQPYFLIGQTEAQKNGQGLPRRHDTSRARSCPILSPALTLGRRSLWTVSCGRTGGPRPSRSSLRRNFSRRPAADAYGTSGGTKEQTRVLPRGDCGPCPSELAARRLREEDARKDFIGKVPPVFASHTAGNSGKVPRPVETRA